MDYDYNTQRKKLVLPEYGRHIQKMVNYCRSLEDPEERNAAARTILAVMGNLNPHLRDIVDFKHKLWDHLAIMSEFQMDFESPYPLPDREQLEEKPNIVAYNMNKIRFKHYGKTIEMLIKAATEYEDGAEKEALIFSIANQMKKSYLTWNRDSIADEQIFKDLRLLSGGKLNIPEGLKLPEPKEYKGPKKNKKIQRKK